MVKYMLNSFLVEIFRKRKDQKLRIKVKVQTQTQTKLSDIHMTFHLYYCFYTIF